MPPPKFSRPTKWTPEKVRAFRSEYFLSQTSLAAMIGTVQQRVNEWERGKYTIGRAYTTILDQLENKLKTAKQAAVSNDRYARVMFEMYGISLTGLG